MNTERYFLFLVRALTFSEKSPQDYLKDAAKSAADCETFKDEFIASGGKLYAAPGPFKLPKVTPAKFDLTNIKPFLPPTSSLFDDSLNSRVRIFIGQIRKGTSQRYDIQPLHGALVELLKDGWQIHSDLTGDRIPDLFK